MKNKTMILLCMLYITLVNTGCKENGILKDSEVNEAKKLVLDKGDKYAYDDLLIYYEDKKEYEAILPFSMIMTYKYNNSYTYFDIYKTTIEMYNDGMFDYTLIKNLDPKSREFALSHLIKGAELGNNSSKRCLAKYYIEGKYLPKNIELGRKLEEELVVKKN